MTFTDAAQEVLKQCGRPLHYKEITEMAIEKNLLSHVGKSPEVTMGARLAATLKKGGEENPLVRVKPGVFALREWDDETIQKGLDVKRANKKPAEEEESVEAAEAAEAVADEASPAEAEVAVAPPTEDEEEVPTPRAPRGRPERARPDVAPPSADEAKRAEIAASATEVFAEEEDDDQPIFKGDEDEEDRDDREGGRRRRRRRRRRGGRPGDAPDMPSYTAKPLDGDEPAPRGPQVIEISGEAVPPLDNLAGRDLADAITTVLGTFDRTVGAVSLRQISDTAQRHGKLTGDGQVAQSQIAAAVRADNARREARGLRPRFRVAGGRVGLTDWLLDGDLARHERDAMQALHRYREAARRALTKKCAELPGHAFVELCLLVLERMGIACLRPVKFAGASGAEAHFTGVIHAPAGVYTGQVGVGQGLRLAIVIRRDGRDLGRERVTELRGSAHHYANAQMGWIFTGGQLLSGAKEEATVDGVMPVTVLDASSLAQLCEQHGVGVIQAMHPIGIPDVDLFEALRSS